MAEMTLKDPDLVRKVCAKYPVRKWPPSKEVLSGLLDAIGPDEEEEL